jgi:hypothetical protein
MKKTNVLALPREARGPKFNLIGVQRKVKVGKKMEREKKRGSSLAI